MRHKIFDQTLWISTILSCSLAVFTTIICVLLAMLNVFLTPNKIINGPNSLYLWNFITSFFHFLSILMFTLLFYLNIRNNVLTKDQLESGWTSANRAHLSWSFYVLSASFVLTLLNFFLIYLIVKLKHSLIRMNNKKFISGALHRHYETNFNLMPDGDITFATNSLVSLNDASAAAAASSSGNKNNNHHQQRQFYGGETTNSNNRLKRIIDFIY